MPICSYEFHGVGLLNTLLWIFIFYSEWMQVIYLYVRQCGLVFPLNSNCLIFCSAEWTLIPKIHRNTQNLYLPGINQASQRSMGEVWITVYVHSNRLRCTDYSYGMFFLHHKFDFKRQSKINYRKHTQWSQLRLTVCKHKRGKYQHTQTQSTCRCMLSSWDYTQWVPQIWNYEHVTWGHEFVPSKTTLEKCRKCLPQHIMFWAKI